MEGELNAVEGTASYEGGAVGVYVKNVFDSAGEIDTATSGHFNADASLTAHFGGPDVPANQENTVTGTIDNFVLQHGEENAWSVALEGEREGETATNSLLRLGQWRRSPRDVPRNLLRPNAGKPRRRMTIMQGWRPAP